MDVVEHTGPGWSCHWLQHAAKIAKAHEAVLIAESPNRFVRSDHYHSVTNPTAQANALELERLKMWTRGVPMYTVLHPDATFEQERSYETRRGPCGRPPKASPGSIKRRRESLLPQALELRSQGKSYREIEEVLKVSYSTVRDWIGQAKTRCAVFEKGRSCAMPV